MSHDLYAAWATTEVASVIRTDPAKCFAAPSKLKVSAVASREAERKWPIVDGVVVVDINGKPSYDIAIEFKRQNEGLHGVLTAIGQGHAYLHKGYSGAVLVLPSKYETHSNAGAHVQSILNATSAALPIGLFTYTDPDPTQTSPFHGKLTCLKNIELDKGTAVVKKPIKSRVETLWGHVREGSTDAHALFCYLQTAKILTIGDTSEPTPTIPPDLAKIIAHYFPKWDLCKFLGNSPGDSFHDKVWRIFWFKYVLHDAAIPPWHKHSGKYVANKIPSKIMQSDGTPKYFFVGRTDSIKDRLIAALNSGTITEDAALREYAENINNRAHSYREDIDSGLAALGLLDPDGKPTDLGYRFVDTCERTMQTNAGTAKSILGAALLRNANFGAFLHYAYKVTEECMHADPLSFSTNKGRTFDQKEYRLWLEKTFAEKLGIMRKVSARGGSARLPFQAEFAILRQFDLIKSYRAGVGLEINWPIVQELMEFDIGQG